MKPGPSDDIENLQSNLWLASCQVKALGEMLMWISTREPALDEEDIWTGYGSLIRALGEKLETWSKAVDEEKVRQASKAKRKKRGQDV